VVPATLTIKPPVAVTLVARAVIKIKAVEKTSPVKTRAVKTKRPVAKTNINTTTNTNTATKRASAHTATKPFSDD
jgi:hypothetical protein